MLFRSNDTATTEIYTDYYTLSLHDALPIYVHIAGRAEPREFDLPNIPRNGEYVDIDGQPYRVQTVSWGLGDDHAPTVMVQYAEDR